MEPRQQANVPAPVSARQASGQQPAVATRSAAVAMPRSNVPAPQPTQPAAQQSANPLTPELTPAGLILQLPVTVVGKTDVGRLLREVQAIDNFLQQSAIREPGTALKLPKTSKLMDDLISFNRINALIEEDRNRLIHFLMEVYSRAPILHMSFSADPTPFFVQKLMTWLRREIHPIVLIQIGMQPNMGAGCVVRTTNKYFDFSLRSRFYERRDVLAQRLKGGAA